MIFRESELAHKFLDPLAEHGRGIEIGGSRHNPFNISNTLNVDYTDSLDTVFKREEVKLCGKALPVDIVAFAHKLPFANSELDFLINSHVFEHQCSPLHTLLEWHR